MIEPTTVPTPASAILPALALLLVAGACGPASSAPDVSDVAANNRGVALMGRFDFDAARDQFLALAEHLPHHAEVQVNLAIATLNRQHQGDEQLALEILESVLARRPEHPRARYCRGLLRYRSGEFEAALEDFLSVAAADAGDADAAYFVGQCLMEMDREREALEWYRRAMDCDPYLRSAYYRAGQARQRLGEMDEATALLETYQRLADAPRARLVEFKYTRMGARAAAAVLEGAPAQPSPEPSGPLFADASPLADGAAASWSAGGAAPGVSAADIDGDGRLDIFLPGALHDADGPHNAVVLGGEGGWRLVRDHPLAAPSRVRAALWGDVDNDGLTDVYLLRDGGNQLWRRTGPGAWADVTAESGTGGGDHVSVDGALFDADHDGDLDIFVVNADGPNELFNNDRDGGFRRLAAAHGLEGREARSRAVVVADLDLDLDVDLLVINQEPPHEVLINELLWDYAPGPGWDSLTAADITAAAAADLDGDGRVEVVTLSPAGTVHRWRTTGGTVRAEEIASVEPPPHPRLELADVDGDGTTDLAVATATGWRVQSLATGTSLDEIIESSGGSAARAWMLASLIPERGPSLVSWSAGTEPTVRHGGPGRRPFVGLTLSGREGPSPATRSNASGIGARVAVRVGSRWTVLHGFRSDSGPGQSLQPALVGLGDAPRVDFVAVDWSDGVYQTELDLEGGGVHAVEETQRQLSSCPVLFAWDGHGWAFVSDILGVGGLGYLTGPGEYSEPRPRETFVLPAGSLRARGGRILLKLAEPMEEVTYLDAIRLTAHDLPPGWSLAVDERMAILGPEPSGRPLYYRKIAEPVEAINERGQDVTSSIVDADLVAAPVGPLDHRFIGRLEHEHRLTLRFPEPLDHLGEDLMLIADGWVEYPYSQTNFAAWQAGADYRAPTLSARGTDGTWRVVADQFGYPAGMPRRMTLPLPALPPGTTELRLSTNQEVYWDRLAVAAAEPCVPAERRGLPLAAAVLQESGFARRTTGPQRLPAYDYRRRAPLWDTRALAGLHTRFGPVDELVGQADGAVAIFGPGEEVHLEFVAPPAAPRPGWTRIYVLEADGWCKDRDRFTRDGRTVEPLPEGGADARRRDELHRRYTTRLL